MSFGLLALIVLAGLLGPLVAARASWRVPAVVGEIAGGVILGRSGARLLDPAGGEFQLLATVGFGLTMVVAGSQIPFTRAVAAWLRRGLVAAALVGAASALVGVGLSELFRTDHALVYGVIVASSSAAVVLPMLESTSTGITGAGPLVAQVAVADVVCMLLLPFALAPGRALPLLAGAAAIATAAAALALTLIRLGATGARKRFHAYSERRRFALELRLSLLALFALTALAQLAGLSVMLAGFALGLVLSAAGEPRRLAGQLFGMAEGFFGPLFFVWLGASLSIGDLARDPAMAVLGLALGAGSVLAHMMSRLAGMSWADAIASAATLGVPVAAATLGIQDGTLRPGEAAAIMLGAIISLAACAIAIRFVGTRKPLPAAAP